MPQPSGPAPSTPVGRIQRAAVLLLAAVGAIALLALPLSLIDLPSVSIAVELRNHTGRAGTLVVADPASGFTAQAPVSPGLIQHVGLYQGEDVPFTADATLLYALFAPDGQPLASGALTGAQLLSAAPLTLGSHAP